MKNYSFIYPTICALFVFTMSAMEPNNPITPDSFTKEGKEYMSYALDLWVESAKKGNVFTGLAEIFRDMQYFGIDDLVKNDDALEKANRGFGEMSQDPIFQTLPVLQKIGDYNYDGAQQLRADVSRVVTQAAASHWLIKYCPDFKLPKENLIAFFVSYGEASIPWNIEILKLNEQLDFTANLPYVAGLTLIMGYLAQTGAGR